MSDRNTTDTENGAIKDPAEWTTGEEPMTGAQASYLKTLSEQHGRSDAFADDLTKAEASKRIDALKGKGDEKVGGAPASPLKRHAEM